AAKYGPEGLDYESYFFIVVEDREIDCGDSDMISILKVGRAAKKYNFNLDSSTQKIYNIVEADKKCSSCSRKACEEYGDIGSCDYRSIIDEEI
ncbi:MAG: hypothetical protein KKI14_03710, partial [Nanoarchaeota archaeon]|nr:hypothetical protein [Nanoarchaeota archaeon]